jgi:glutaredoxin
MQPVHVDGKVKGKVLIYTLSTCGWCKKTKAYLKKHHIAYDYIEVDLLEGDERDTVLIEIRKWNPRSSFPTMVIDDNRCIAGYDEEKMKKELEL